MEIVCFTGHRSYVLRSVNCKNCQLCTMLSTLQSVSHPDWRINMKRILVLAVLMLLLSAVSSVSQDVRYNFDKNTDFSKFRTYKWVPIKDAAKVSDLVDK